MPVHRCHWTDETLQTCGLCGDGCVQVGSEKEGEDTRTPVGERELIISGYTVDGVMQVYTSDYSLMAKFDKFVESNPDVWKLKRTQKCQGDVVGKDYECPARCISFRAEPPKKREMTEEQKEMAREQFRKYRESKNS